MVQVYAHEQQQRDQRRVPAAEQPGNSAADNAGNRANGFFHNYLLVNKSSDRKIQRSTGSDFTAKSIYEYNVISVVVLCANICPNT